MFGNRAAFVKVSLRI